MSASIYIETAGCAFNVSDGEAMAGVLRRSGYEIAAQADGADVVVLNTCTVKDRTFLDFQKRLRELRTANGAPAKPVVVAGCIPKAFERTDLLDEVSTLGPDALDRIGAVVREALRGRVVHELKGSGPRNRPSLPILRRNPVVEILPIARGCKSACTFCQTRLARGRLMSFHPEEIVSQARRALGEGVRELWVTGQDTGVYGHDIGASLPRLLGQLLELEGDFRIRLGMSSPQWIAERMDEVLDVFEHPKMFRFLHVPIQSGSESVLRHMKRDGTVEQFEAIHEAFMSRFPEATFLTDIIAGYPTETEEDFEATLGLLERLGLPATNCSKFSARPGTAAARLPQHHSSVISRRSKRLTQSVRKIAARYHEERIGRRYCVLVENVNPDGSRLGRTDAYRPVLFEGETPLGGTAEIEVMRGEPFRFFGRLAESSVPGPKYQDS